MRQYEFMKAVQEDHCQCGSIGGASCYNACYKGCPIRKKDVCSMLMNPAKKIAIDEWIKQYEEKHMNSEKYFEKLDKILIEKMQESQKKYWEHAEKIIYGKIEEFRAEIDKLTKQEEKPDPRIGKLCKVWDGKKEPDPVESYFSIVLDIHNGCNNPFECQYDTWSNARLLTEAEIDQFVRSGE